MGSMKNGFKRALIVGAIVFFTALILRYLGVGKYLSLEQFHANKVYLQEIVSYHYVKSVLIYIGVYTAVIALAIPAFLPLTIIGGFLFGLVPGVLYAAIGATVGSTSSFLIMRYVMANTIRMKYGHKLEKFNERIKAHGVASYLLTLQLLTVIPYFVINALAALADVPFFTFVWTTLAGSLPLLFVYSFAGRELYVVESIGDIFSPPVIILFVLLIFLSLLPMFLRWIRQLPDV